MTAIVPMLDRERINPFRGSSAGLDFDFATEYCGRLGIEPGAGVTVAHFDEGWNLDHPVFQQTYGSVPKFDFVGDTPIDQGRSGHGTSVLGLHAGRCDEDSQPLLPGAHYVLVQARDTEEAASWMRIPEVIELLSASLPAVLLIARDWSSRAPHLPFDLKPGYVELLRQATRAGIVVVLAAGNGGIDLDSLVVRHRPGVTGQIMDCNDPWVMDGDTLIDAWSIDTGALLVGACTASLPFEPWSGGFPTNPQPRSNRGSRITCWAPGEGLTTAGESTTGSDAPFMSTFGGTSGASAIITAAIAALQSIWKAIHPGAPILSPGQMQSLLRNPDLGHSVTEGGERIGSVPDLRKIIDHLRCA